MGEVVLTNGILTGGNFQTFSPLATSPRMWHDFADITKIGKDESKKISLSIDKAAYGINGTQGAETNQPVFVENSQNNRSGMLCDGNNDYLSLGLQLNSFIAGNDKQFSWLIVANTAGDGVCLGQYLTGGYNRSWYIGRGNSHLRMIIYHTGWSDAYRWIETSDDCLGLKVILIIYDGTIDTNDGLDRFNISINGVAQDLTMVNANKPLGGIFNSVSQAGIGSTPSLGSFFNGTFYEIAFWDRLLAGIEIPNLVQYEVNKWGI